MQDDDFSSLLGDDVVPANIEKRATLNKSKDSAIDKEQRRLAAESAAKAQADPLAEPLDLVDPLSVLSYQRPGVQHGVFKNLRLGKCNLDASLDLHKLTVEQARKSLYQFVYDCMENDVRSALITHGKGEGRETPAKLKSCVAAWLPQLDPVLAFHTAIKQPGGYGATYILIKKSKKQKEEAREKFSKKRPK